MFECSPRTLEKIVIIGLELMKLLILSELDVLCCKAVLKGNIVFKCINMARKESKFLPINSRNSLSPQNIMHCKS